MRKKKLSTQLLISLFRLFSKKYILFESYPDYCDNTGAVYDYIVKNNLDKDFCPVWVLNNKESVRKGIKSFVNDGSFLSKIKFLYYNSRKPVLVFCNNSLYKLFDDQKSIYLSHGSALKNVSGKYDMSADLDYCLVQSKYLEQPLRLAVSLTEHTKMVTLGFPRNDDLLLENSFNKNELFDAEFEKMVVWYPTFRQHKTKKHRNTSSITLPIIYDEAEAIKINEFAKNNKILIVLKPHFAQDTSYIKNLNLSNIVLINDDFLVQKGIRSYQLLNLSDALITDYSSVYYDYLLTDKPVGLTRDDYDEYSQKESFAVDADVIFAGGEKIYNSEDFCAFLKNLADGNDVLKTERNKVKDLTNEYQDSNSAKRVSEFILNTMLKG
jgi:CDP-glycerol glycerophosphotransferase (TagB/SpsB family)